MPLLLLPLPLLLWLLKLFFCRCCRCYWSQSILVLPMTMSSVSLKYHIESRCSFQCTSRGACERWRVTAAAPQGINYILRKRMRCVWSHFMCLYFTSSHTRTLSGAGGATAPLAEAPRYVEAANAFARRYTRRPAWIASAKWWHRDEDRLTPKFSLTASAISVRLSDFISSTVILAIFLWTQQ